MIDVGVRCDVELGVVQGEAATDGISVAEVVALAMLREGEHCTDG